MEHKFLKLYKDGVWIGNKERTITVKGEAHDLDVYAKQHGIELPDAKKPAIKINKQEEKRDADMEQSFESRGTEES